MLSIDGPDYATVFKNLSTRAELTDSERAAAGRVAEWFAARDRLREAGREKAAAGGVKDVFAASEAEAFHSRCAPFFGPTSPESHDGQDWRTFCIGKIRFVVRPYTTGGTMNVGVESVAEEAATK